MWANDTSLSKQHCRTSDSLLQQDNTQGGLPCRHTLHQHCGVEAKVRGKKGTVPVERGAAVCHLLLLLQESSMPCQV